MLAFSDEISLSLNILFEARYVGNKPGETTQTIAMHSSQVASKMTNSTQENLELAIAKFLQERAQSAYVLDVKVNSQILRVGDNSTVSRLLQREGDDDGVIATPASTVEVSVNVVGDYRPPPEVDFSGVVEDAIDADPQDFDRAVRRSDEYFEIFESIERLSTPTPDKTEIPPSPERSNTTSLTVVLTLSIFSLILVVVCAFFCRNKRKQPTYMDPFVEESELLQEKRMANPFSRFGRPAAGQTIMDEASTTLSFGHGNVSVVSDHIKLSKHSPFPVGGPVSSIYRDSLATQSTFKYSERLEPFRDEALHR